MSEDLLDVSTHFRFGENWAGYATLVDDQRLAVARDSVKELVGDLSGKSFLDIGSGSGLFSVAALRLGATRVLAVDIDEDSVATTRRLLETEPAAAWRAELISVFDLPTRVPEQFDVVYSWGFFIIPAACGARSIAPARWSSPAVCSHSRSTSARHCAGPGLMRRGFIASCPGSCKAFGAEYSFPSGVPACC